MPRLGEAVIVGMLAAIGLVCAGCAADVASSSEALIAGTSANVNVIACPPSVVPGAAGTPASDTIVYVWQEPPAVLAADLDVDITVPGVYPPGAALTPGVILAGTSINSDYIHFLPVNPPQSPVETVCFATPILGVIILDATHDSSNFLGCMGTNYGVCAGSVCGLEQTSGTDGIQVGVNCVKINIESWALGDRVRVITEAGD